MTIPPGLKREVEAALPGLDPHWHPLTGGRTNRLWKTGEVVVKSYRREIETPLFPNEPEAEAEALRLFYPKGFAPKFLASGHGWLAYAHLAGTSWRSGAGSVAALLGRLHATPTEGMRLPLRTSGAEALWAQTRRMLEQAGLTLSLPAVPKHLTAPAAPVHGDAVPGNIVVGPKGMALIDWQCPGIGDPAEDLSTFLSPAMQSIYRGSPLTPAEVEEFVSAYPLRPTLERYIAWKPVYHMRMAAHCAIRAARGDADYAEAQHLELLELAACP